MEFPEIQLCLPDPINETLLDHLDRRVYKDMYKVIEKWDEIFDFTSANGGDGVRRVPVV